MIILLQLQLFELSIYVPVHFWIIVNICKIKCAVVKIIDEIRTVIDQITKKITKAAVLDDHK